MDKDNSSQLRHNVAVLLMQFGIDFLECRRIAKTMIELTQNEPLVNRGGIISLLDMQDERQSATLVRKINDNLPKVQRVMEMINCRNPKVAALIAYNNLGTTRFSEVEIGAFKAIADMFYPFSGMKLETWVKQQLAQIFTKELIPLPVAQKLSDHIMSSKSMINTTYFAHVFAFAHELMGVGSIGLSEVRTGKSLGPWAWGVLENDPSALPMLEKATKCLYGVRSDFEMLDALLAEYTLGRFDFIVQVMNQERAAVLFPANCQPVF